MNECPVSFEQYRREALLNFIRDLGRIAMVGALVATAVYLRGAL